MDPLEASRFDIEGQQQEQVPYLLSRASYTPEHTATLSWRNLVVKVKDSKGKERKVLNGVDGFVNPHSMLAILGPSGSGKSILLDTLAGRLASNAHWEGDIRVNGHKTALRHGRAAYVMQQDELIGTLTVAETLHFVSKLRLPTSMTDSQKRKIVDTTIGELGLDSARDTFVGNWHLRGISGGQRRRVSIACELITSPKLLFLDEPTSGLDAAASFHVMSCVCRLAEGNRTIITVIHQPSSETFELFDKLCLLASGDTVYFGEACHAADMFASVGLAVPPTRSSPDHFLHCINQDFESKEFDVESNIAKLVVAFKESQMAKDANAHLAQLHTVPGTLYEVVKTHPGWLYQTFVLTWRTLLNNGRNIGLFWMRLAMFVMIALAVAFVYFQTGYTWKDVFSRSANLFYILGFLTFMSIAGFPAFAEDMKVYIRERLNGYYTPSVFTVANTLASVPFIFLIAVVCTVCVYFISALRSSGEAVIYFILALFMSLSVVESLMMAIAPIVPNFLMGIAAGAGILGMMMLVCGFFQPLNSMPQPILRYPLTYVAYHTYGLIGFMRNEFEGTEGWGCPCAEQVGGCPPGQENCTLSGDDVLAYYEILPISKWLCLLILGCMVVFYRTMFWGTLRLKEYWSK